jgi:hypothetical protein
MSAGIGVLIEGEAMDGTSYPTRCDWCGRPFDAHRAGCRTCVACEVRGAPDQSAMPWQDYAAKLVQYRIQLGQRVANRRRRLVPNLISDGPGRGGRRSGSGRRANGPRRACGG